MYGYDMVRGRARGGKGSPPPPPPLTPGRGIRTPTLFFLLWHPLFDGGEVPDSEVPKLVVVLDSDPEGPRFNSQLVQYFKLRFFGFFCVCMLPPGLCLSSFFLVWFMSACYPKRLPSNRHRLPTNRHRLPTNRHRRAYWTL